jgi:hypothetical protein
MSMSKIYGATERQDGLYKIGRKKYELIFGYGEDEQGGYNYRETFKGRKPELSEIKDIIVSLVNASVDEKILSGYQWQGKAVWLSSENQFNFKAAHDLAVQTGGKNLPVKFKIGELEDSTAVYHTFETTEELTEFVTTCMAYMQQCLQEGWTAKDSIDWTKYECDD